MSGCIMNDRRRDNTQIVTVPASRDQRREKEGIEAEEGYLFTAGEGMAYCPLGYNNKWLINYENKLLPPPSSIHHD